MMSMMNLTSDEWVIQRVESSHVIEKRIISLHFLWASQWIAHMDYCRIEAPQPIDTTHGIKNDPTETYFPMKNDIEWIKMALEWYKLWYGYTPFLDKPVWGSSASFRSCQ
jgi:hypothetical protein